MIPAGLRIVFDREETGILPKLAARERFDDAAQGEIVVGDLRRGCGETGPSPAGMIVGQANDRELRKIAVLLEVVQVLDEIVGAKHVREC